MNTVFFTGFPGFLGSELLMRILARDAEVNAACLVQPKYAGMARQRVREANARYFGLQDRIRIVEGDIAEPGLGLENPRELAREVTAVYHLAAIYDLSAGRDIAMRINVSGTRHMLDFAASCPGLERFHYVSTCYVSGTHKGRFSEDDLDCGQGFHNFYEETKFLAEVDVRNHMRSGLPATIYRPSVVVGDSGTGATQKYDGPYSVIRLLLRQPGLALVPVIGDPRKAEVNVVPRDFVMNSITFLSRLEASRGMAYHLADPNPLTVDEMLDELARATDRKAVRVRVPLKVAKIGLSKVPGASKLIGIPANALDYFIHPAHYVTDQTQAALEDSGVRCPGFREYSSQLVGFVRAHPEIGSEAMA